MTKGRLVSLLTAVMLPAAAVFLAAGDLPLGNEAKIVAATQRQTILSDVYIIDQKYRSMMGPSSTRNIQILDSEIPELVWITGYEAVMVAPDGETPVAQQFMCHSNLDIDPYAHSALLGKNQAFSPRLFTLSQGQLTIRFPTGFGIPLLSNEVLDLTTQVLNLHVDAKTLATRGLQVRHKVSLEFVREQDVKGRMSPLFPIAGYGLALIAGDSGHFGERQPQEELHGPGCLVGRNASDHEYPDPLGRKFSGHWVVPPGREVNRTLVTHLMNVPYDTTMHYIAVHLHPFAESLELRDLTTGESLFKSEAENFEGIIGLARVDDYSSVEGIPVFADHQYEMVSIYNNTTAEDQDSMAVMYMYLRDRDFDVDFARRAIRSAAPKAGAR